MLESCFVNEKYASFEQVLICRRTMRFQERYAIRAEHKECREFLLDPSPH